MDYRGNGQASIPFIICRDNEPRRRIYRRGADCFLIGFLIRIPMAAFFEIGKGKLPILARVVDAFEESLLLLLLRHVQEEFKDHHAVVSKIFLEAADLFEAPFPEFRAYVFQRFDAREVFIHDKLRVYPGHEHIFIMTAVVDRYFSAGRQCEFMPPEIGMIEFIRVGCFETINLNTQWVKSRHDMLHCSIFARCIHRLKDNQYRVTVMGV